MLIFVALCINQFARRSSAAGSMYALRCANTLAATLGAIAAGRCSGLTASLRPQCWVRWRSSWICCPRPTAFIAAAGRDRGRPSRSWRGRRPIAAFRFRPSSCSCSKRLGDDHLHADRRHRPCKPWLRARLRSAADSRRLSGRRVGLAIALAVFSFVGFESATAFGAEAKRPLVTIPRAVDRQRALRHRVLYSRDVRGDRRLLTVAKTASISRRFRSARSPSCTASATCECRLSSARSAARSRFAWPASRLQDASRYAMAQAGILPLDFRAHRAASTILPTSRLRRSRRSTLAITVGADGAAASRRSTFSITAARSARSASF